MELQIRELKMSPSYIQVLIKEKVELQSLLQEVFL